MECIKKNETYLLLLILDFGIFICVCQLFASDVALVDIKIFVNINSSVVLNMAINLNCNTIQYIQTNINRHQVAEENT